MSTKKLLPAIENLRQVGQKWLAVLIDPEDVEANDELLQTLSTCSYAGADLILVGGSLADSIHFRSILSFIKKNTKLPVFLFPGNAMQVADDADGILFLSLISGRNPDLLIGQHVAAAPALRKSGMEVISCGYMLIDGSKHTSVSYISQTLPIPADKPEIAVATACAGEMLGLKCLYLETGSGAKESVNSNIIQSVRKNTSIPIIVGGGLRSPEDVIRVWQAGADIAVVGTAIEKNADWLLDFAQKVKSVKDNY